MAHATNVAGRAVRRLVFPVPLSLDSMDIVGPHQSKEEGGRRKDESETGFIVFSSFILPPSSFILSAAVRLMIE